MAVLALSRDRLPAQAEHASLPDAALTVGAAKFRAVQKDLNHWVPLLNHFDSYLSKQLAKWQEASPDSLSEHAAIPDLPQRNIIAILQATCQLLKHCLNKQTYSSLEV